MIHPQHEKEHRGRQEAAEQHLPDMAALEMPDSCASTATSSGTVMLFDQGVIERDPLVSTEAREERIRLGRAARAIDDRDFPDGKMALCGQALDRGL